MGKAEGHPPRTPIPDPFPGTRLPTVRSPHSEELSGSEKGNYGTASRDYVVIVNLQNCFLTGECLVAALPDKLCSAARRGAVPDHGLGPPPANFPCPSQRREEAHSRWPPQCTPAQHTQETTFLATLTGF